MGIEVEAAIGYQLRPVPVQVEAGIRMRAWRRKRCRGNQIQRDEPAGETRHYFDELLGAPMRHPFPDPANPHQIHSLPAWRHLIEREHAGHLRFEIGDERRFTMSPYKHGTDLMFPQQLGQQRLMGRDWIIGAYRAIRGGHSRLEPCQAAGKARPQ
ncbi:MAG: hypothetical protein COV75_02195 [Candidatus Omnitrophica bacterium CG11_big_fil_rev_8_21_14_0_20_63_9]|nr:MAG: hypothetical protein COV75_02195 [Candidatus Omnitrophica bacterium CG11_big_fil_rev_8_21_14_0_20_63_9]